MGYGLNCCCQPKPAAHVEIIIPWMGFDPFIPYPYVTAYTGPDLTRTKYLTYRVKVDYDVYVGTGGGTRTGHSEFVYSFTKFGGLNKSGQAPINVPGQPDSGVNPWRVWGPGWAAYSRETDGSYTTYQTDYTVTKDRLTFTETWTPKNELGSSGTILIEYILEDEWPYDGLNGFYEWAVNLWLRTEPFTTVGDGNKKTRRLAIIGDGSWTYYPSQAFLDSANVADGVWVESYSTVPSGELYFESYWGVAPPPYNLYPLWWRGLKSKRTGVPVSVCVLRSVRSPRALSPVTSSAADYPKVYWHDTTWMGDFLSVLLRPIDTVTKPSEDNFGRYNTVPSVSGIECVENLAP
jgi:hypothetical protein